MTNEEMMTLLKGLSDKLDAAIAKRAAIDEAKKQPAPQSEPPRIKTAFGSIPDGTVFANELKNAPEILPDYRSEDEKRNASELAQKIAMWKAANQPEQSYEDRLDQVREGVKSAIGMSNPVHPLSPEYQIMQADDIGGANDADLKAAKIVGEQS